MGDLPSSLRAHIQRSLLLAFLTVSVVLALRTSAVQGAAPQFHPPTDFVPPHPRLWEAVDSGAVRLPGLSAAERRWPELSTGMSQAPNGRTFPPGQIKILAVLVDFSDKPQSIAPAYFDRLVFETPKAGRGSLRDYFAEVSYGQIDLVTLHMPGTLGWKRAPNSYAYYVDNNYCHGSYPRNCEKLAEDVVDLLESTTSIDFSDYDNDGDGVMDTLILIHSGPGAEYTGNTGDIWSHAWSLNTPRLYDGVWIAGYLTVPEYFVDPTGDMTIGPFAHELVHSLFWVRDLYDTDSSSRGVGDWSLMGYGVWNGSLTLCEHLEGSYDTCSTDGSSPAWPDAWSRIQMGWFTPDAITTNTYGLAVPPTYLGTPAQPGVYRISSPRLGGQEYFLVENRQPAPGTYDEYLPGGGLLVWRIDDAMYGNSNECLETPRWKCSDTRHAQVVLEQADGLFHLEQNQNYGDNGDPFASGEFQELAFDRTTTPDTSSYYGAGPSGIAIQEMARSGTGPGITITADFLFNDGVAELVPRIFLPWINQSELSDIW